MTRQANTQNPLSVLSPLCRSTHPYSRQLWGSEQS
jgi:hypothetical protein